MYRQAPDENGPGYLFCPREWEDRQDLAAIGSTCSRLPIPSLNLSWKCVCPPSSAVGPSTSV
jgi:hypothetical protein